MKLITTLVVAAVALVTAATAAPMSSVPKLTGTVGPGFTISLKKNGKAVKTLKAGKYTFVVTDKASIHNFVVEGPGFERAITSVPFKGTKTITITLKKGKWEFYCKPHESGMHGDFRVT
jgi:plastocyanin